MSDDREYEDLEALLKAPGWLRYKHALEKQWRDEYDAYVNKAAADADDAMAMSKLRQIIAARKAILAALEYPAERLRSIEAAAKTRALDTTIPLSRRGSL